MEEIIIVNKPRLPVIIGDQGKTKRLLEKKLNVSLEIDSHTAEINIVSEKSYYEIYLAKKIINAIARGFSPFDALLLLKENNILEILHIQDYVGKNTKRVTDIKGRIIGKEGKIKDFIENRYGCKISVYGKTIAIILKEEDQEEAIKVIQTILAGAKHKTAFKMMRKHKIFKNYKKEMPEDKKIDDISFE